MMKHLTVYFCALLVVIKAVAGEPVTIDGQVFVRMKAGESIKLSLVAVLLYDEKTITEYLQNTREVAKPLLADLLPIEEEARDASERARELRDIADKAWGADIRNKQLKDEATSALDASDKASGFSSKLFAATTYLRSAKYYFRELPNPLQTTKTDADGKFSFQLPGGSYVLVASSTRHAGKEIEEYFWMVKTDLTTNGKIMLANDNLSSSGFPDSMIRTPESEASILWKFAGVDIDALPAFVEATKREQAAVRAQKQEKERQAQQRVAAETQKQAQERQAQEQSAAEMQNKEKERQAQLNFFRLHPEAAQQKALELYPGLGMAGSPLNKEFVARVKRYKADKKEFFAEPDWPIRLAEECNVEAGLLKQATGRPLEKFLSHTFNANGYCIRCGWAKDFVQRTNRSCIK